MNVPGIGTLTGIGSGGRLGVVVGARALGPAEDGEQLYELRIKTVDGRGARPPDAHRAADPRTAAKDAAEQKNASSDGRGKGRQMLALPPPEGGRASGVGSLPNDLNTSEQAELARLQQRDAQVRQEEKAHAAAAGDLAGPINYIYQVGPDGRQYAVGGTVQISGQTVTGDPAEAARLGNRVANAAMAAHNPSAQDLSAARAGYQFAGLGDDLRFRGTQIDISA